MDYTTVSDSGACCHCTTPLFIGCYKLSHIELVMSNLFRKSHSYIFLSVLGALDNVMVSVEGGVKVVSILDP